MTSNSGVRRSLEGRIVLCADCNANRTLSVSTSGNLVCSTCGSDNWMYQPITAIVKETVSIKGELSVEEDLTIEGRVKGRIELKDHILWISPNGKVVDAQIHAGSVIIAGNVMGDISASEMVAIKSSGSMAGNIKCPRISIADGARFKGSIDTEAKADTTARPDLSKAALAHL
ncbi:MAG: hypothetical protein DMG05_13260 [Acidobacteria bacterium]|nr:MAG: hypothetical protein DMG05_13260 [Acidobacteriota bacterium]